MQDFAGVGSDVSIFASRPDFDFGKMPEPLIYDCMDDWNGFDYVPPEIGRRERAICEAAHKIWVVSRSLQEKFADAFGDKIVYVPNGVDYEHFASSMAMRMRRNVRPILGYVGAVDSWFDLSLVGETLRLLNGWEVIIVGPVASRDMRTEGERLGLRFLGRKEYRELPGILSSFDVAMIPFRLTPLTNATSPIKLYEYLAAGLPVVATPMPEVLSLEAEGIVTCADSPESFARAAERLVSFDKAAVRQELAQAHSWRLRFDAALAASGFAPRRAAAGSEDRLQRGR